MSWLKTFGKILGMYTLAWVSTLLLVSLLFVWFPSQNMTAATIVVQNGLFVLISFLAWHLWESDSSIGMGWQDPQWKTQFLYGSVCGFLLIIVIFLLQWISPWLDITQVYFKPTLLYPVLFSGAAFLCVAIGEEVFSRGYIQTLMVRQAGPGWGIAITSLFFASFHFGNPHFTWVSFINIVLAGLFLGLARHLSGSLWLPIGIHLTWNWTQSFFTPVSGMQFMPREIVSFHLSGPSWITGGNFGFEGSVFTTLVLSGAIFLLLRLASHVKASS
ncbi:CPBP family intramembrane glutamic endopeptidase [Mechercharimyces sp. CAU 1602]|uniref:CPBP family intramembrane glutamic endopeptidase n=1 Tax=Mechercharimyces sp. CAU 1602 TaxID=2973933 RepID=UPI002161F463|nr:type II CAAX endopeptidase family protein [Mechercharimyces sp. CAU 1602]MCS1350206.1 CPBP family intramembrane metalloprotease [Mechercharimyces sp. CAU 1602]